MAGGYGGREVSRLTRLENNIKETESSVDQLSTRENVHSAKLSALRDSFMDLQADNEALKEYVVDLKSQYLKEQKDHYVTRNLLNQANTDYTDGQRYADRDGSQPPQASGGYGQTQEQQQQQQQQQQHEPQQEQQEQPERDEDYSRNPYARGNLYNNADTSEQNQLPVQNRTGVGRGNDTDRGNYTERDGYPRYYQTDPGQRAVPNFSDQTRFVPPEYRKSKHISGEFLFLRFNHNGLSDVRKALNKSRHTLKNINGQIKGMAEPEQVRIIDGMDHWMVQSTIERKGDRWIQNAKQRHDGKESSMAILVMYFENYGDSMTWLQRDPNFKQFDFPNPHGYDAFVVPLNYIPNNDKEKLTFMMSEFNLVTDGWEKCCDCTRHVVGAYGGLPSQVDTAGSRHFRGCWLKPNNRITVHRFDSSRAALAAYNDDDFQQLRREFPVRCTICFTLDNFV